jgi:arylsulfatase A-like enzyme
MQNVSPMTRSVVVSQWFFRLMACALVHTAHSLDAAEQLNVVVVTIDDLGAVDLGCDGSTLHESPYIDRLAHAGIRFTAAYAAAPVCSPTRAALMTGKHPARLGMTIWHEAAASGPNPSESMLPPQCEANLPHQEETLAERLSQAGYATYHVGKWHLGDARHYPETHGFDINIGGTLWGAPPTYFWPYRGTIYKENRYVPGLGGGQPGEYLTDRLTDAAIELIKASGDRPIFLNLCYHSVHTPIEAKPKAVEYFRQRIATQQSNHHQNADYAAMIQSVDENIGRLLAALDESGMTDNTLFIVTSDNGGVANRTKWGVVTSNAPLRSGKGSLYEGGVRVPLIVRWPKVITPGQTCETRVVTQDLFATIVEATSISGELDDLPQDGVSLVPLLRDPTILLTRPALFWHFPHYYYDTTPVSAVLSGRYKLLHYYEDDRRELYDLIDNPAETKNLAADRTETVTYLNKLLENWLTDVNARLPQTKN